GEVLVGVVEAVHGQAHLLEVVGALDACGRLAHLLHRRQEQADQHGDDGNDNKQLDQRKAGPPSPQSAYGHGLISPKRVRRSATTARTARPATAALTATSPKAFFALLTPAP